ncbi:hypothetical protein DPMN_153418 [Dreissena polymorpha]|uniref:Uncharacterized protein n=1 Tax=Dreissena polymorpha TaxID=45954 RepID=A0A9D4FPX4_DREPO|nr:hypothetical protein DPMN_153418 [Dreissena polymorpha]
MFYVLTVAGEHGIPAEYGGVSERRGRSMSVVEATDDPAFMTEVSGLSEDQDWRPDYIKTIDVPESLLVEIRKMYFSKKKIQNDLF